MRACDDFGERFRAGFGDSLHESWMIRTEVGEDIADAGLHNVNEAKTPQARCAELQCFLTCCKASKKAYEAE